MISDPQVQEPKPSIQKGCGGSFEIATLHAGKHTSATLFSFQTFLQGKTSRVLIPSHTPAHTHPRSRTFFRSLV